MESNVASLRGIRLVPSGYIDLAKQLLRLLVFAVVAYAVWRAVDQSHQSLIEIDVSLADIKVGWLAVAAVIYLIGMVPSWFFWQRTLVAMGQLPRLSETLRAFYIGHLGKYVPGKALVVILRTSLVNSTRTDTTVAATSIFIETLTYMAVGAMLAASILLFIGQQWWTILIAILLMAGCLLPTIPFVFRSLVRLFGVTRLNPSIEQAMQGISFKLLLSGWLTVSVGWVLMGLSLWATLQALPSTSELPINNNLWSELPLLTACVSLASVAGFLSMIPGGFGVREFTLVPLLAEPYGIAAALAAAVLLRMAWLVAEMTASAALYVMIRSPDESIP
jgi:uncharacterized membrane protein YbhN (UPF0104 family)